MAGDPRGAPPGPLLTSILRRALDLALSDPGRLALPPPGGLASAVRPTKALLLREIVAVHTLDLIGRGGGDPDTEVRHQ
jgi:hypothetical protein